MVRDITRFYTREAGVRGLDRELAKIARTVVKAPMVGCSAETLMFRCCAWLMTLTSSTCSTVTSTKVKSSSRAP